MKASPALSQIVERLPEPLRRDPKKSAILSGLLIVMAGVMLKQFVFTGDAGGPAEANASQAVTPIASTPGVVAVGNPAAGNRGLLNKGTLDPVEQWLMTAPQPLTRNPFEFRPEFFQTAGLIEAAVPAARVVSDELFWDRLAKSIVARADQKKQRQIRIENLQVAAGKLRVQSTILGNNPRVLIGGRMSSVGDTVEAQTGGVTLQFRILRIEGRRIVLEREGVKLELPMGADRARVIVDERSSTD